MPWRTEHSGLHGGAARLRCAGTPEMFAMARYNPPSVRRSQGGALRRAHRITYTPPAVALRALPAIPPLASLTPPAPRAPNPYGAYERHFTMDGGVRFIVPEGVLSWNAVFWDIAGSLSGAVLGGSLFDALILTVVPEAMPPSWTYFLFGMVTYFFICTAPETHWIEIRPDCMILDGRDVFWLTNMELGWPMLRAEVNGEWTLVGTYGTRNIEFLKLRKTDENDRTAEVFASHLQRAMQQLWGQPAAR